MVILGGLRFLMSEVPLCLDRACHLLDLSHSKGRKGEAPFMEETGVGHGWAGRVSGPLGSVHLSRQKWLGGSVN